MIITIDGPEKAGKSTLISALKDTMPGLRVRNWGPVDPDDRVYTEPLSEDARSIEWTVWDRCWASEHVYGRLLNRDRRLAKDAWLGEWLHGRAVQARGARFMLLPDDVSNVEKRRDSSDLPVDPYVECGGYKLYAESFGWTILRNSYTDESLEQNILTIRNEIMYMEFAQSMSYVGPYSAHIVFVEDGCDRDRSKIPGSGRPFTTESGIALGRRLGYKAFKFGWTEVGSVSAEFLQGKIVVACGEQADEYLQGMGVVRICIPHPAWLYQRSNFNTIVKNVVVDRLLTMIGEHYA